MHGLASGVAHVSYKGGSVFLPAHNPYDRELIAEEVWRDSKLHGAVQILLNDDRWLVRRQRQTRIACAGCGRRSGASCYSGSRGDAPFCITCALSATRPPHARGTHADAGKRVFA